MMAEQARAMIGEDPPSFALPMGGLGGSAGLVGPVVALPNLVNATANVTANVTTTGTATLSATIDEQRPVFVASLVLM